MEQRLDELIELKEFLEDGQDVFQYLTKEQILELLRKRTDDRIIHYQVELLESAQC